MDGKWLIEIKNRARELVDKIPYQQIRDSPSVKYYTDWGKFDQCLEPQITEPGKMNIDYQIPPANILLLNGRINSLKVPMGINTWRLSELGDDKGSFILKSFDLSESKALARHVANLIDGSYVEILQSLREPIRIINITNLEDHVLVPTHHTLVVNDNVNATLGLYIMSDAKNNSCQSTTVELYLGNNSTLNLLIVSSQELSPSYTYIKVIGNDNSVINIWTMLINGAMNHHREDYILSGRGVKLSHTGLEIGLGTSRIDYLINLMHLGENSTSYSKVTGISKDKAFVIHRGLGRITEKAKWSDTTVEGKVFILNEGAYAASVPIIMVDTGDVNGARHSAADASLDEDQVNYLRLRGISKDEVIPLIMNEVASRFLDSLPPGLSEDVKFIKGLIMSKIII